MIKLPGDELRALEKRLYAFNTLFSNIQRSRIFAYLTDLRARNTADPELHRLVHLCVEDNYLIHLDRIESKEDVLYFMVMPFEDLPMYIGDPDDFRREYAEYRLAHSIVLNPDSPSYKPWHNGTLPLFPKRNGH